MSRYSRSAIHGVLGGDVALDDKADISATLGEQDLGSRADELARFSDAVEAINRQYTGSAKTKVLEKLFAGLLKILKGNMERTTTSELKVANAEIARLKEKLNTNKSSGKSNAKSTEADQVMKAWVSEQFQSYIKVASNTGSLATLRNKLKRNHNGLDNGSTLKIHPRDKGQALFKLATAAVRLNRFSKFDKRPVVAAARKLWATTAFDGKDRVLVRYVKVVSTTSLFTDVRQNYNTTTNWTTSKHAISCKVLTYPSKIEDFKFSHQDGKWKTWFKKLYKRRGAKKMRPAFYFDQCFIKGQRDPRQLRFCKYVWPYIEEMPCSMTAFRTKAITGNCWSRMTQVYNKLGLNSCFSVKMVPWLDTHQPSANKRLTGKVVPQLDSQMARQCKRTCTGQGTDTYGRNGKRNIKWMGDMASAVLSAGRSFMDSEHAFQKALAIQ